MSDKTIRLEVSEQLRMMVELHPHIRIPLDPSMSNEVWARLDQIRRLTTHAQNVLADPTMDKSNAGRDLIENMVAVQVELDKVMEMGTLNLAHYVNGAIFRVASVEPADVFKAHDDLEAEYRSQK